MQANEEVAKKLASLTMKAKLERAELQQEILELRSKPRSLANVGVTALKTVKAIGVDEIKLFMPIAKTVILPASIAIGKVLAQKSSPKRVAGVAGIVLGALGIFKGIQFDNRHKKQEDDAEYLPEVIPNPPQNKR